ncbi:MAG: right-handed parallel beta-helix repeat-containing protein [Thermoguttaceae bacterium]|nr:right-handed parallel beta-helix repeat-containing protein [Thermoguttaceae bacterium]
MKDFFSSVWTICFVCLLTFSSLSAKEFYVSPQGKDHHPGTVQAPVQTLKQLQLLARQYRKDHPDEAITLYLNPGIYMVSDTVSFNKSDSGTQSAPLTIKAVSDNSNTSARPHLVGGLAVTGWQKTTFNGRNDVYVADLKPFGITTKFKQLYLDGVRQIWSRYPNQNPDLPYSGGWMYVDGTRPPMYKDIPGETCDTVVLRPKNLRNWSRPTDGEVCIFPRYNWWNRIEKIKSFDPTSRTITLDRPMQYAARPEDRFPVFGMKEELDSPGEWYQDVENQKLYYLPPAGIDLSKHIVTIPTVQYILSFDSVSFANISGLEFSCAADGAVCFTKCNDCLLEKSLVHDLGYFYAGGITIRDGFRCKVQGCDVWHIGGHGIEVYGGEAVSMTKCLHCVDNCYIHHVGQFNRHGLGIMIGGVGITLSHNLIHDTPRCGIFHGGVLHTLEYNRIRHCNTEMEDTGCTYGGGWTGGWTTIRYNHCTDSIGFNNHGKFHVFAWGIYLDESGCGFDVYGNIVERCQVGGMHLHNARENHIENNIFVSNAGPEGKTHQFSMSSWNNSPQGVFLSNRQPGMLKAYDRLIANPQWKKMRGMHISPADPFLPDGTIMRGNRIERNIFYYPDQPESKYMSVRQVNFEYNSIDYNVVWNGGKVPVNTGASRLGRMVGDETSRIPFGVMLPATPQSLQSDPNQTAARDWSWFHKTLPDMKSELFVPTDAITPCPSGTRFLRFNAAFNPEKKYIKNACVKSKTFSLVPGKDYRLRFEMKMPEHDGLMLARVVSEGNGLWKIIGATTIHIRAGVMTPCELDMHYPAEGQPEYDKRIGDVSIHFQFLAKTGTVEIGNLRLEETVPVTPWEAWQESGADRHSIVADPLFVNPAGGDWQLKNDSPAMKLGFKQIPFGKIGPYKDAARVSWPIQEASGVREHPEWLTSVPVE